MSVFFFIFAAMNKKQAIIGLGGNIGDREGYLAQARRLVDAHAGVIVQASSLAETKAWGFEAPPFLNQIVVILTELEPLELLDVLQGIEHRLGRTVKTHHENGVPVYHNRTIDLDILDYDNIVYQDERLTLPHPHIREREFVLQQLREMELLEEIVVNTKDTKDTKSTKNTKSTKSTKSTKYDAI